jgi:hypothetical protein
MGEAFFCQEDLQIAPFREKQGVLGLIEKNLELNSLFRQNKFLGAHLTVRNTGRSRTRRDGEANQRNRVQGMDHNKPWKLEG